jgi:hypothetical protein
MRRMNMLWSRRLKRFWRHSARLPLSYFRPILGPVIESDPLLSWENPS